MTKKDFLRICQHEEERYAKHLIKYHFYKKKIADFLAKKRINKTPS